LSDGWNAPSTAVDAQKREARLDSWKDIAAYLKRSVRTPPVAALDEAVVPGDATTP
jgi:hypothetical protein